MAFPTPPSPMRTTGIGRVVGIIDVACMSSLEVELNGGRSLTFPKLPESDKDMT
jgi:hypothetical protein